MVISLRIARGLIVVLSCVVLITGCGRKSDEEIAAEVDAQIALRAQRQETLGAEGKAVSNITVMVESIAVPQALYSEYISAYPIGKEADALRRKVQIWLKSGTAATADIAVVSCRGGQRASSQAVHESILPAPFATGGLSGEDGGEAAEIAKEPATLKSLRVGRVLQVAPLIGSNGMIALSLDFELSSRLPGSSSNRTGQDKDADSEMPEWQRVEAKTKVKMNNGSYVFLGTGELAEEMQSPDFKDPILLLFVRADAF